MADYADIILKLEKAKGPSRALDRAIADLVFDLEWRPYGPRARKLWGFPRGAEFAKFHSEESVPRYTSYIDEALWLVPEGLEWQVHSNAEDSPGNEHFIGPFALCEDITHEARIGWGGGGAAPAIALCIAALKARASLISDGGGRSDG